MINHDAKMVAPCGMNCTYCYVHHKKKKPCMGCRIENENKPTSCRKCKIKECVFGKNLMYCSECVDFPCAVVKRLDKSYQKRYEESLVKNLSKIEDEGMENFLRQEKERLKCPNCKGFLNIHDKICYLCEEKSTIENNT